jgi:serine/threonine-protein kinase
MQVILQVTAGSFAGQSFTFHGQVSFLVGRSRRAQVRLARLDRYFSRIHFLVEVNPPRCRILDMGSRNGTHVNGQRVEIIELNEGDVIKAGHTYFRFHLR